MTERIEINPAVMLGKPVIRNSRIPVELVLRKLAEVPWWLISWMRTRGSRRMISGACLAYAADTVAHEELYPLSSE
jgi:uncharacterized protein (DUF433 family)